MGRVKEHFAIPATLAKALEKSRANWAEGSLRVHAAQVAVTHHANDSGGEGEETAIQITDLICNLQHLCRRHEISFNECLQGARAHFEEETRGS